MTGEEIIRQIQLQANAISDLEYDRIRDGTNTSIMNDCRMIENDFFDDEQIRKTATAIDKHFSTVTRACSNIFQLNWRDRAIEEIAKGFSKYFGGQGE